MRMKDVRQVSNPRMQSPNKTQNFKPTNKQTNKILNCFSFSQEILHHHHQIYHIFSILSLALFLSKNKKKNTTTTITIQNFSLVLWLSHTLIHTHAYTHSLQFSIVGHFVFFLYFHGFCFHFGVRAYA